MKRTEQINFEQAVYDSFGPVKDFTLAMRIAEHFYKKAEKELGWHSVEESLPETDEEVIVLADSILTAPFYRIGFGHIVKGVAVNIDGKLYKPISHNGWNIPGVKYWMPCPEIPNND